MRHRPVLRRIAPSNVASVRLSLAALTILITSSCITAPPTLPPSPTPESEAPAVTVEALPTPSEIQAFPSGDETISNIAAEEPALSPWEFLARADVSPSPERERYLLRAATLFSESGDVRLAGTLIGRMSPERLDRTLATQWRIVAARLAQRQLNHERALSILALVDPNAQFNVEAHAEVSHLRAQSLLALGRRAEAITQLMAREHYLQTGHAIQQNHWLLWSILDVTNPDVLRTLRATTTNVALSGWLDLALLYRESPGLSALQTSLDNWSRIYPSHPGSEVIVVMMNPRRAAGKSPRQIGVLLPLASEHGQAAQAVYDGFMAMHDGDPHSSRPNVILYDIGAEPDLAGVYYKLAVDEGADFIVGPLGKKAVDALTDSVTGSVPILLLGNPQRYDGRSFNIFQLGLSPEEESGQVARRAYTDGHRFAGILYPNTDWGRRMESAFRHAWQTLGGTTTVSQQYASNESDHSLSIKQFLNIDESELRERQLEALISKKLEFRPRRRRDIDFIFLVANTKQGRLLKPQINFFHAHDVSVYSTSHIYAGRPDPVRDADLNGITFGDMPWMLDAGSSVVGTHRLLQGGWHAKHTDLDRLYALGMDAYNLIPVLDQLRASPESAFHGITATLRVAPDGRLYRTLRWARFEDGVPVALDPLTSQSESSETEQLGFIWPNVQTPAARSVGGNESL